MSGVRFTEDQQKAIDTLDKSVLVSAAAGSGKTAVLIERIINIILQGKADVDEMLVVTFTNAAATEMRLKLAKAIRKHIKEHPESAAMLKPQLNKLYRAYISTFNSFAIRVIREFFYEVDIEPAFSVCDEIKGAMLMSQSIDELFDKAFAHDDFIEGCSFREFLRLYSSDRSEEAIKADILATYNKLRSMPDYYNWAFANAEVLKLNEHDFLESNAGRMMMDSLEEIIRTACSDTQDLRILFEDAELMDIYLKETDKTQSLAAECIQLQEVFRLFEEGASPEEILEATGRIRFDRLPTPPKNLKDEFDSIKDAVKIVREHYKKLVSRWVEAFLLPSYETRIREMNESYKYTLYYLKLIQGFEEIYAGHKKELSVMDFSDMEHTASGILEKPEIAAILRKRFKYIFIDEYQDTNNLQEHLISTFARPDNVFKVGDVKQSIYKFRQAEPAIFERVKADYSSEANEDATAINLNRNFRSNSKTLDYINSVFADVMEGYDDDAALKPGLDFGENDRYNFIPEAHILYDKADSGGSEEENDSDDGADEIDEELGTLSREEAEAKYVAGIVNSIIGQEFYDSKNGVVRKASARDITILLRSVKVKGDAYVRALRNHQIDAHVEEEADYFDTIEIRTAFSFLQTIDNCRRDIPLIATLHSEIFAFSPDELAEIRASYREAQASDDSLRGKRNYYQAAEWYELNGPDQVLRDKLHEAFEKLRYYRTLSRILPLDEFIWKILVDTDYYLFAGAIHNGSKRQANLRALVDRAGRFTKENIATLSDFINYLEVMQTKKIKTGQSKISGKDDVLVQITTIHKSKGLEYPYVIVAGLGQRLANDTRTKGCVFDSNLGVSAAYVSPDKKFWRSSILQRIILDHSATESYKEELRVLYVAMTRARNKLILVGTTKNNNYMLSEYKSKSSYLNIIGHNMDNKFNETYIRELVRDDSSGSWSRVQDILASRKKLDASEVSAELAIARERLDFEYSDKDVLTRPSKVSVSTLRKEELEAEEEANARAAASEEEIYNLWKAVQYKKTKASRANIGTAYHRIMEYIDFAEAVNEAGIVNTEYIDKAATSLVESGAIDPEVWKSIKLSKIHRFFSSPVGLRAAAAARNGSIYKEKPFTLQVERDGHPLLVQGIIDCCFIENNEFVLVDYKSNYINYSAGLENELERLSHEYKVQTDVYKQAIEEGTGLKVKEVYLYLFYADRVLEVL